MARRARKFCHTSQAPFPEARPPTKKELALQQRWSVDKLIEQKQSADDLIAKLARKVIDGYLLVLSVR